MIILLIFSSSCGKKSTSSIVILETTDIHGVIMPFDYIEKKPLDASLANSVTYIRYLRNQEEPVFLLDNGDNLQGQPAVYYYNYIDTVSPHFLSEVMNWLMFDAGTVGNHDIEAGHAVYDRLSDDFKFPLLAANAVDVKTGQPYFTPFVIIEKNNIRIAVLGLITPAVPTWLPEKLYSGIEFMDMVETAQKWMPEILKQNPDLVVGLFHSGWDRNEGGSETWDSMRENGAAAVAYNVPGFDIIFCGHDHRVANERYTCKNGDSVLILNGGSRSEHLAQANVTFCRNPITRKIRIQSSGKIINVNEFTPDKDFVNAFIGQDQEIKKYVNKVIGNSTADISSRDAYFGPSAYVDMIHSMQLEIAEADISFAAPLSFDVQISKGPLTVGDLFKLYRFENMLYTIELTGAEIKKYLEYSYSEWLNTMHNAGDYLLKYRIGQNGKPVLTNNRAWLRNQPYDFDSAAGLDYIVDASKPDGERITIIALTGGGKFDLNEKYRVAVNSHRGSGGGGHLTEGAGLKSNELRSRLLSSTKRDLRYYIMQSIEEKKTIEPSSLNNWRIIPQNWAEAAAAREYVLLFGASR
ncbi:MAG: bifunctional metallophosphatase/5'-nucleotidase [Bacteroidales bacterium]|nr:bifunctional metallophosphatase/5'-nucleotidase [Bacteroidales bacterium]